MEKTPRPPSHLRLVTDYSSFAIGALGTLENDFKNADVGFLYALIRGVINDDGVFESPKVEHLMASFLEAVMRMEVHLTAHDFGRSAWLDAYLLDHANWNCELKNITSNADIEAIRSACLGVIHNKKLLIKTEECVDIVANKASNVVEGEKD